MRYLFTFLLVIFLLNISCANRTADSSIINNLPLDSFIIKTTNEIFAKSDVPGIFIAVLDNGERSYYTAGYADQDKKILFDSLTIVEIGSITKTFNAYILESVLKEKVISESSSIHSYLPDSVQTNKSLEKITFLKLLNHSSGLPRLPENMNLTSSTMTPYDNYGEKELYSYLKVANAYATSKSSYSNLGMGLAGVLAEKISGKKYADLVNDYVVVPFKMNTNDDQAKQPVRAQGYIDNEKSVFWNMDILAPAGNLKMNANQMLTYLSQMSVPANKSQAEIIDLVLTPTIQLNAAMKVCRGWHTIEKKDKPTIYWHNGGTYGFSTQCMFTKGNNKAVFVVVNQFDRNKVSEELAMKVMEAMMKTDN